MPPNTCNPATSGDAESTIQPISSQITKLTIISIVLATAAFISSMVSFRGAESFEFTPVAFALVVLHHGSILIHQRWYSPSPFSVRSGGLASSLATPLFTRIPVILLLVFIIMLWSISFARLVDVLVMVSHNSTFLGRRDVIGIAEFVFIVLEIITLVAIGVFEVKAKRVVKRESVKVKGAGKGRWL